MIFVVLDHLSSPPFHRIHLFIPNISIAPLQVHHYSAALPTQHGYCAGVSCQSATGNGEWRIFPRSLRGGWSRMKGTESTNEPPRPTHIWCI